MFARIRYSLLSGFLPMRKLTWITLLAIRSPAWFSSMWSSHRLPEIFPVVACSWKSQGHPQETNNLPTVLAVSPDKRYVAVLNNGYGSYTSDQKAIHRNPRCRQQPH